MQERKDLINIFFIELLFYILLIQNETNCTGLHSKRCTKRNSCILAKKFRYISMIISS